MSKGRTKIKSDDKESLKARREKRSGKSVLTEKEIEQQVQKTVLRAIEPKSLDLGSEFILDNITNDLTYVGFDIRESKYLEIHYGNIYHYFSAALITPAQYIANRTFTDIQSINQDFLILGNGPSNSGSDEMILLEISIPTSDESFLNIETNFAFTDRPIPITRIKKILVKNEFIKQSIISDSQLFDGGFIPESLIEVQYPESKQFYNFELLSKLEHSEKEARIDKFDKILGLLAFLRNYNILVIEAAKVFKTLPTHFFCAVQAMDPSFGSQIINNRVVTEFYTFLIEDNCPADKKLLKWIFERVNISDNFSDQDIKDFAGVYFEGGEKDGDQDIRRMFMSLTKNLERKNALKKAEGIKSKVGLPLYLFSYLRNYANYNSVEIARLDVPSIYSPQHGEYAFALLGYFFGYKRLRNTETRLDLSNDLIKMSNLTSERPAIKFELKTQLDYYIIELTYNHLFGVSRKVDSLINEEIDIPERLNLAPNSRKVSDVNIFETILYGTLFQNIYYNDPLSEVLLLLNKLGPEIPFLSELGWYCYRNRLPIIPYFIDDIYSHRSIVNNNFKFTKVNLLQFIESNKSSIDFEELKIRLNLSQHLKEF